MYSLPTAFRALRANLVVVWSNSEEGASEGHDSHQPRRLREREREREEDASREHEMQHKDICEEEDIRTQFIREEKHVLLKRKKHPRKQEGI